MPAEESILHTLAQQVGTGCAISPCNGNPLSLGKRSSFISLCCATGTFTAQVAEKIEHFSLSFGMLVLMMMIVPFCVVFALCVAPKYAQRKAIHRALNNVRRTVTPTRSITTNVCVCWSRSHFGGAFSLAAVKKKEGLTPWPP